MKYNILCLDSPLDTQLLFHVKHIKGGENLKQEKVEGGMVLTPTENEKTLEKAFARHAVTVELMDKLNMEIEEMSPAEFAIYINAVEIPHTKVLQTKKSNYEKEGNKNEKN